MTLVKRHAVSCPDCGWTGSGYRSQAQAAYALRKHSCHVHRARGERAQRVAARKAASGPARDCTCPNTFHAHGTRNAYVVDRCRCRDCRDAAAAYERRRAKDRAYGRDAYVDATPAREHVRALQAQGMGWKRIAHAAGLNDSVVWKLIYGAPQRGTAPSKRITPRTSAAILAVALDLAEGTVVDSTGTRRRLQALGVLGWSISKLALTADVDRQRLDQAMRGGDVTTHTARTVAVLYDRLWDTPPPTGTTGAKVAATRTRNVAQREGWAPALAWDDIDDPTETPDTGERPTTWGRPALVTLDALHDCAIEWGMTVQQAADRLGVGRATVERALLRLADDEVRNYLRGAFARNAIAQGHDRPTRDGLGLRRSA